jgi:hypothetical protein
MPLNIPDALFEQACYGPKPAIYHGPDVPVNELRERYPAHQVISANLPSGDWIAAEWGQDGKTIRIGRAGD